MGCGCSTAYKAINMVPKFDIARHFHFRKGFSIDGFNEYSVFIATRDKSDFDPALSGRGSLQEVLENIVQMQLFLFLKRNPVQIRDLTFGEEMHISEEIRRSVVAHILGAPQVYTPYDPNRKSFLQKTVYPEAKYLDEWAESVVQNEKGRLDPDSSDPMVINALELRMINAIISKIRTYQFEEHFARIIGNRVPLMTKEQFVHLV